MPQPAVTVVIPCFNHGAFVREAVDSALRQRGADVRVVVVNDGSDDGTTRAACDACATERVRVIHQENRGLPAARNVGAAGATGEYLVFLDADDWIEPEFVERLHAKLAGAGEDASHAYCRERLVGLGQGEWKVPEWDPLLMMITNLHPVTTLVKRRCFEAVSGFDESMRGGYEDWDLWLRFVERGWRGVRVPETLFVWRRHSPATMVMGTVKNHEALYRGLMERHAGLFARHKAELLARSNTMLCQFEMNWFDEELRPINLAALKRHRQMYESMLAVRAQRALERRMAKLRGWFRGPAGAAAGVEPALKPAAKAPSAAVAGTSRAAATL
jgi:glycosyltransferase involved in cell wall biosynthesis